jgi:hypothetical protein
MYGNQEIWIEETRHMAKKEKNKNSFQVTLPASATQELWKIAAELQEPVPHLIRALVVFYSQIRKDYPASLGMREVLMRASGLIHQVGGGSMFEGDEERRTEVTARLIEDGEKLCKARMVEVQKEMKKKGITPLTPEVTDYAKIPTMGEEVSVPVGDLQETAQDKGLFTQDEVEKRVKEAFLAGRSAGTTLHVTTEMKEKSNG